MMARFAQGGVRRDENGRTFDGLRDGRAVGAAGGDGRNDRQVYARGPVNKKALMRVEASCPPVVPEESPPGGLWVADSADDMLYLVDLEDQSVLLSFAAPGGTSVSGLAWDGVSLWVSNYDLDRIYRVDPSSGATLHSFPAPAAVPWGLMFDGTYLRTVDKSGTRTISRIDQFDDGAVESSIGTPGVAPTGLSGDSANLWYADERDVSGGAGTDPTIFKLDPSTGATLGSFVAPGFKPTGLAWDGTNLWHADIVAARIYQLEPTTGAVISSFASPGPDPTGLAWQPLD